MAHEEIDKNVLIKDAMDKILKVRADQVDAFVTAILKVRQDIDNEVVDMNHIALQYGTEINSDGKHTSSVKVVYMKQRDLMNCYNCNKYINHGFGWIECTIIPKSACIDIKYCNEWKAK